MSIAVSINQDGTRLETAGKYVDQDIVVGISDSIKKPAATYTPTTADQTIAAGQYLSGAQTIKGDANLVAGNIKEGVSIFGVTGTVHEGITPSGTKSITTNGTYDVTQFAGAIVEVPTGGAYNVSSTDAGDGTQILDIEDAGSGSTDGGVIFIDYDGSIVESWDAASVASKTALPNNPTHARLVAQGWNWSLANIKSYISKYEGSKVFVGQMYKTTSGLTEFDITLTKVTGLTVTCNMVGNKNWGDGTQDALTSHTYTNYGDYTITCDGTTVPQTVFGQTTSNVNRYPCISVFIGENVTSIGKNAFYYCYSLTSITIPDSVTSIGNYSFYYCHSLTNITIPDSVTSIGSQVFYDCFSLTHITIPDGVTSIGNAAFYSCHSLTNITIPDGVTSIDGSLFHYCRSLTNITIPDGVTSIGNTAFYYCHSLASITIPDSVTSIGNNVFYYCYSLTHITIPDGVTSIGNDAFYSCSSITKYDFTVATAIPTLAGTSAFYGINGICKIVVPDALYDTWIAATNWSTYANYIYKASEV